MVALTRALVFFQLPVIYGIIDSEKRLLTHTSFQMAKQFCITKFVKINFLMTHCCRVLETIFTSVTQVMKVTYHMQQDPNIILALLR